MDDPTGVIVQSASAYEKEAQSLCRNAYSGAAQALHWMCPDHMKCSFFLKEMHSLQGACASLAVFTQPLFGKTSTDSLCEFVKVHIRTHRHIAVPVVLSSWINHIVILLVDAVEKKVVYYDPQGTSPFCEHRKADRLHVKNAQCSVVILCKALQSAGQCCQVLFSPVNDQTWRQPLSCGLMCIRFIEAYVMFPSTLTLEVLAVQIGQ